MHQFSAATDTVCLEGKLQNTTRVPEASYTHRLPCSVSPAGLTVCCKDLPADAGLMAAAAHTISSQAAAPKDRLDEPRPRDPLVSTLISAVNLHFERAGNYTEYWCEVQRRVAAPLV